MLFPGAAFYMEKIAVGPSAIDAIDITRTPTENVNAVAEALGEDAARGRRRRARARPPRGADRRAARGRRAREADPRRRRRAGDRRGAARHGRRHALRDRRHARGRHLRGGAEVRRRRHPGTALAAQRRRAAGSCSTRASTPTRVLHTNDLVAGEDVFVAATGVTTGCAPPGRPVHAAAARSPTRSSCARARAPCGASARSSRSRSCPRSTGFEYTLALGREPGVGDCGDVTDVRPAAAAEDLEPGQVAAKRDVPLPRGRPDRPTSSSSASSSSAWLQRGRVRAQPDDPRA